MATRRYPPPEGDVLGAFMKELHKQRSVEYVVVRRPDEEERNRAEVDYVLRADIRSPEIAVEVSTAWRSEKAGKEDADWTDWTEAVQARVRGRIPAEFRLYTPLRIPLELRADEFAEALVEVIRREHGNLADLYKSGAGAFLRVHDTRVFVSYAKSGGSDLVFGRMLSKEEADGPEWREHVRRVVTKKSEKLRQHKDAGRETWLVAYNTFSTPMNPLAVREAVLAALSVLARAAQCRVAAPPQSAMEPIQGGRQHEAGQVDSGVSGGRRGVARLKHRAPSCRIAESQVHRPHRDDQGAAWPAA
jgi:hypothetical protein